MTPVLSNAHLGIVAKICTWNTSMNMVFVKHGTSIAITLRPSQGVEKGTNQTASLSNALICVQPTDKWHDGRLKLCGAAAGQWPCCNGRPVPKTSFMNCAWSTLPTLAVQVKSFLLPRLLGNQTLKQRPCLFRGTGWPDVRKGMNRKSVYPREFWERKQLPSVTKERSIHQRRRLHFHAYWRRNKTCFVPDLARESPSNKNQTQCIEIWISWKTVNDDASGGDKIIQGAE